MSDTVKPSAASTALAIDARVCRESSSGTMWAGTVIDLTRTRAGAIAAVRVRWDGMNPMPVWYLPNEVGAL